MFDVYGSTRTQSITTISATWGMLAITCSTFQQVGYISQPNVLMKRLLSYRTSGLWRPHAHKHQSWPVQQIDDYDVHAGCSEWGVSGAPTPLAACVASGVVVVVHYGGGVRISHLWLGRYRAFNIPVTCLL